MYATDTIAAVATAPGRGGVGIVRISGPHARAIVTELFRAETAPADWTSHRLYYGTIADRGGCAIDEALAVLMLGPRSYTGEDVVELQCHGGPVLLRQILTLVLRCGARLAEPGEFTRRAFLNGRLDLTQAEAVIDIVEARGNAAASLAVAQLGGALSDQLADIRETLVQLKSLLEAQIDFSEEDFEVDATSLHSLVDAGEESMQRLIDSYQRGKLVRDGIRVVIAGKPNVGKSSLLNALLAEERAIVTALPGTTRDTIEETADFGGIPVVLTDTAGLRRLEEADPVEQLGMARTAEKLAEAEVCVLVLDGSRPLDADDQAVLNSHSGNSRIIVLNKIDLPRAITAAQVSALQPETLVLEVSAKTREGLDRIRAAVVSMIEAGRPQEHVSVISNLRHRDALAKAVESLRLARQSLAEARPPDVVAVDVQDAIDHVGAITGVVTSEEVLDRIFSQFCIGK